MTSTARAPRIAVVVPAFNEERLIARTLSSIPAFVDHIVVIDDASRDGTFERARSVADPRVEIIRLPVNRGVGSAIVTGYQAAFAQGADVCAVMAGDGQMHPGDLERLVGPVVSGKAHYAKGDRISYPAALRHMPVTRFIGNVTLSALTRLATGLAIRDSQCGYTVISREAASALPLERLWPRYGYPNDLLGMLSERGFSVREVVVRPVYAEETSGVGVRHALGVVPYVLARVLLRRALSALSGALSGRARLPSPDARLVRQFGNPFRVPNSSDAEGVAATRPGPPSSTEKASAAEPGTEFGAAVLER